MSSPATPFQWNEAKARAAVLVAEDDISNDEIAATVGIHRDTLYEWKKNEAFAARVKEHLDEIEQAMMRHAISKRHKRIGRLQRILDKIDEVIDERADKVPASEFAAAGSESGLLVAKPVFSHAGDLAYEWKFDAALVREYRALMEQSAKELGQLTDRLEVSGDGLRREYVGVNIEVV